MDDARLQTVWRHRQVRDRFSHLSEPITIFMKHKLARKVRQLGKLAEIWDELIPKDLAEHTALEGFTRGALTVMVDSAAHRFQLQTLLSGGLQKILQQRFPGALNKVRLVPGQFSSVDVNGSTRYEF